MVDVIQRLILEAETGDTKRQLADVRKAQKDLSDEISRSARDTDKAKNEYKEMVTQLKGLVDQERQLEKQLRDTNDAYGDRSNVLRANDRFDRTSEGVSLAGDVESNARTIGGALGAAGLTGAERAIGLGAEIPAVLEAVPRLKESLAGIPQVANQAAKSLGLSTSALGALGLGAAAAVAIVSLALKEYNKRIEENKNAIQGAVDTFRSVENFSREATSEDLERRLQDIQRAREAEIATIEATTRAQEEFANQAAVPAFAQLGADYKQFTEEIKNSEETIRELELEERLLNERREEGAFAAADAAAAAEKAREAEEKLAQAREEAGQAILEQAAFAGELVALQQASAEFNEEELATKRLSLEQTKAQTQAELALLEARSNGSEVVKDQIANLRTEIEQLDESIAFLDSAQAKQAAAANTAREAEEELRKEREKSAKSTRSSARTETKASSGRGFIIGSPIAGRARAVAQEAESGITSAYQDAFEERANLTRDYNEQETRIKQEALFAQKQDLEQFKFAQDRLLEQGDFTSAFNRQREKAFQQTQDRDRILFDQSQRRDDLFSQIDRIASALATKIQVELQPNAMFNTTVKNISVQASTINRSF